MPRRIRSELHEVPCPVAQALLCLQALTRVRPLCLQLLLLPILVISGSTVVQEVVEAQVEVEELLLEDLSAAVAQLSAQGGPQTQGLVATLTYVGLALPRLSGCSAAMLAIFM